MSYHHQGVTDLRIYEGDHKQSVKSVQPLMNLLAGNAVIYVIVLSTYRRIVVLDQLKVQEVALLTVKEVQQVQDRKLRVLGCL